MLNNFDGGVDSTPALRPQTISGSSDVNGITIDKRALDTQYQYAKFAFSAGAKGGSVSPTSLTLTFRAQHSDASGSGWADISDTQVAEAAVALADENTQGEIAINLRGTKRYVRLVALPAFTGGTSPNVLAQATLILAEPKAI